MGFGVGEVRQILFEFKGDASDLEGESRRASGAMDGTSKSASGLSSVMGGLKTAAIGAAVGAGVAATAWLVEGAKMSQTADLIDSSFDKTFGDTGDDVLAQNEALRKSLGLSEAQFQKMAVQIGAVNRGMGQTEQEAADATSTMVRIAGDLAAFNGELDAAPQALEDMGSALVGNYETMDKWGVNLTAAMVAERALIDSNKENASELTELEKRTAALALIQEQAALSSGALTEAQEQGATGMNEFKARMADVQTELGSALLPLLKVAIDLLLILADILEALAPLFEVVGKLVFYFATGLQAIINVVRPLIGWLFDLERIVKGVEHEVNKLRDMFDRAGRALRNAFSWTPPSWVQSLGVRGFSFHSGGVVPGPPGSDQLVRAQAGERIVARNQSGPSANGGGGGGPGVVINISAGVGDPLEIGRQVADVLTEYTRVNGPLDISVTGN